MQSMQSQLERERQKLAHEQQMAEAARMAREEGEREKMRAEKRAAKEKRREEARLKEAPISSLAASSSNSGPSEVEAKSCIDGSYTLRSENKVSSRVGTCCWTLLLTAMTLILVGSAMAFSIIWIYTNGKLDQRNLEKALPIIHRDVNHGLFKVQRSLDQCVTILSRELGPVYRSAEGQFWMLLSEWQRRQKLLAMYVNENLGPYTCRMVHTLQGWGVWVQTQVVTLWKELHPVMMHVWRQWIYPSLIALREKTAIFFYEALVWIQENVPSFFAEKVKLVHNWVVHGVD